MSPRACDTDLIINQPQSIVTFSTRCTGGTEVHALVSSADVTHLQGEKWDLSSTARVCARVWLPLGVDSSRVESGAGETIPGTVRVPGQTTVGTFRAVEVTLVQSDLGHAHF